MLVDSLLANDALTLLVHRLGTFNEKVRWCALAAKLPGAGTSQQQAHTESSQCLSTHTQTHTRALCSTPHHPQVPEEASAVYNVLSIIENMIEVTPAIADTVVEKTKVGAGQQEAGPSVGLLPAWLAALHCRVLNAACLLAAHAPLLSHCSSSSGCSRGCGHARWIRTSSMRPRCWPSWCSTRVRGWVG